jgi:hypothetical protein
MESKLSINRRCCSKRKPYTGAWSLMYTYKGLFFLSPLMSPMNYFMNLLNAASFSLGKKHIRRSQYYGEVIAKGLDESILHGY